MFLRLCYLIRQKPGIVTADLLGVFPMRPGSNWLMGSTPVDSISLGLKILKKNFTCTEQVQTFLITSD